MEKEIDEIAKVVKINQKDHAQGHICPDTEMWLRLGVNGLINKMSSETKNTASLNRKNFMNAH